MVYPVTGGPLVPSPNFPEIETDVLDFWRQDDTFRASIQQRDGAEEFVFYDGPPFANGLPHYGHLLTGFVKDVVPRFRTMCGYKVDRRFGWDTHGLPAELEAMRELGMTEKSEIETMGIEKFNAASQRSVLKYTAEWEDYVTRQARWVDFDNDYKTLDLPYMESVMWAFKTLWEKGLAYEGYSVLPYCWNDQTPLSNHELRMDEDVYQDRQDLSVTVTFPLCGDKAEELGLAGVRALAWTTTPWTLPTNFSLAVGPEIRYVTVPAGPNGAADAQDDGVYLLAEDLVGAYAKELGYEDAAAAQAAVGERVYLGADLEYVRYQRLWDIYTDADTYGTENAWIITVADYVSTTDGTGVVHQATAYGEEDQKINAAYGIPVIVSVDDAAAFLPLFSGTALDAIAGMHVFEANKPIVRILRESNRLFRQATYVHSYPHCWRCRKPLIYKAVSSWFVKVTQFRDRMIELNENITWIPDNVKHGQFGKWLEGARDWAISRNRYWGSPIPVWKSDDPAYPRIDVYGSLAELERDFGTLPLDRDGNVNLHRPFIDELTRPNPDDPTGRSTMRRVTDVLDCWFESGAMPFAQVHYPFENREWFDTHYPADFIVEYIGQTRGWFYLMHVLATALFDSNAFSRVVCHGIVLGDDGFKASKSRRNYPDVEESFKTYGADAVRWYLMSTTILRGGNLVVTEQGIRDAVRQLLIPLWNVYYFLGLYANAAGAKDDDGKPAGYRAQTRYVAEDLMDRYVLAKTGDLVRSVRQSMDDCDIPGATETIRSYLDTMTNWYVRRSRERFWQGREEALDVLYTCLETLLRVTAPLAPMVTEKTWQNLTGGRSVHLTDFPDPDLFPCDPELVTRMDRVRDVCSVANGLRKTNGLRARLPLSELIVVAAGAEELSPLAALVADELNVKAVRFIDVASEEADALGVEQRLVVNARTAGPRLGKQVQQAIKGSKTGDWSQADDGTVTSGGIQLVSGEYTLDLVAGSGEGADGRAIGVLRGGDFVALDLRITPDLEAEGCARDVIRTVQAARRDAGFDVSDRIRLTVTGDPAVVDAVREHQELLAGEVLASKVCLDADPQTDGHTVTEKLPSGTVTISVAKN
ncbi:isoleucine--tRNA ligase [Devriesea agamarum]|uniref:isoleucine--tRNA ligase n=1 Tax=Devriesea agamarum TaxID=472569 RepID=UPI00071DF5A8|nr:isoleucine--tRNA ligase [Devriesea agamarum]